jgi:cystathionine beta-lyase
MAALAVAVKLAPAGSHIVAGDDIYGGTSRLLSQVVPAAGVSVSVGGGGAPAHDKLKLV